MNPGCFPSATSPLEAGPGVSPHPDEHALVASVFALSEPVLVTRADLAAPGPTIIAASPAMTVLVGYAAEELAGRSPRLFQGPLTERAVLDRLRRACEQGARFIGATVNYRKDGSAYFCRWTIDPVRDAAGRITHFFSLQADVTDRVPYGRQWLEAEERARAIHARAGAQMALLTEAILVLEKTKRSFRSKELGVLRERLVAESLRFGRELRPGEAVGGADKK